MEVFLRKQVKYRKARLLAPFLQRYRCFDALSELPAPMARVVANSVLLPEHDLLFVKNSKAACTTLCHHVYFWQKGEPYSGSTIHRDPTLDQGLKAYPDLVAAFRSDAVAKVATVRDPIRRCVSAFTDFVLDRKNQNLRFHAPFWTPLGLLEEPSPSVQFDLFLDYVEACMDTDLLHMDEHFRPQFWNLRPDLVEYDQLLRVEHLADDLAAFGRRYDLPIGPTHQVVTKSNRSRNTFAPSSAQIARIQELYQQDLDWVGAIPAEQRAG